MPYRTTPLVIDQTYHVYNRGAAKQPVFIHKRDYQRFQQTFSYYRYTDPPVKLSLYLIKSRDAREQILKDLAKKNKRFVDIISYVLMPNHFHFILKQRRDNGISNFIRFCLNSYTKYFNTKRKRVGSLFQGPFKTVHVASDEQLIHLSRYIHLNPLVSFVVKEKDFLTYPWSSLSDYIKENPDGSIHHTTLDDMELILSHFRSPKKYLSFVLDQKDYAKEIERIKHLTLEKI